MTTTKLLWIIFISLLAVLLPHTAWLFYQFEEPGGVGIAVAVCAALAFEASIAVLTHKLSKRLEEKPKGKRGLARFTYHWANAYSLGLIVAISVSSLANLAHAVQFGHTLAIFDQWGIPPMVYQVAFGAILPLVSLLFAKVLSNASETEDEVDPALVEAKQALSELRKALRTTEQRATLAEAQATEIQERFNTMSDVFARLFSEQAKIRIIAANEQWPALPQAALAIVAGSSPAYVSEVLKGEK